MEPTERHASEHRERGASLVEMALVANLLFLLLVGVVDFGRAFYTYITVANAAREGARFGATHVSADRDTVIRNVVTLYTTENNVTIDDPEEQIDIDVRMIGTRKSIYVEVGTDVPMILGAFVGLDVLHVSGWGEMPLLTG